MTAAGWVLTGGASRRMGRDKALLPYGGATLVEGVAGVVRASVGHVALVGGCERYAHLGIPIIDEDFAGCGPLSGLEAALRQTFSEWNVVVACDSMGVQPEWIADLLHLAAASPEADAVVPESPDGRVHPLLAVWHRRCQPDVRRRLSDGKYKLISALDGRACVTLHAAWTTEIRNVNTPHDWASAEAS